MQTDLITKVYFNEHLTQSCVGMPQGLQACDCLVVISFVGVTRLLPITKGSNPGQGSKGINFSGWHGLDMSVTVTKRR